LTDTVKFNIAAVPSTLRVSGGREIPFVRVILSLSNTGDTIAAGVVPHASLSEERGLVHDATEALRRANAADLIPPGGELKWDLYELLLAAHPGVTSKVHLWGYKAVLNWWIDFSVWAEYREKGVEEPFQTAVSRWRLRWIPGDASSERIEVNFEKIGDSGAG
jgi:hypothetical protein